MPRLHVLTPPEPDRQAVGDTVHREPTTRAAGVPQPALRFAVDVRDSAIDGQGAFAAEAIAARRKIGEIRGEAISLKQARQRALGQARIMIIAVSDKRAIDATQASEPLRYVNHSCRPNAVLRVQQGRVEFYAMRDLSAGDEITVNYGETHHGGRLACRCGVAGCRGSL